MVHVMFILGNKGTLGACKAFDVATHVLPIFHFRASYKIALFAILSLSKAFVLFALQIHARNMKRRFVGLFYFMFIFRQYKRRIVIILI